MSKEFKLRLLEEKDSINMLEWMHDDNVTKNLKNNFREKKITDCLNFIVNSKKDKNNINLAITNNIDEYLGTVSLKNIDYINKNAEFAITIRKKAMGTGCAIFAMKEIIKRAFYDYNLKNIYWYVDKANIRAIKFYEKNKFQKVNFNKILDLNVEIDYNENYIWYLVKDE